MPKGNPGKGQCGAAWLPAGPQRAAGSQASVVSHSPSEKHFPFCMKTAILLISPTNQDEIGHTSCVETHPCADTQTRQPCPPFTADQTRHSFLNHVTPGRESQWGGALLAEGRAQWNLPQTHERCHGRSMHARVLWMDFYDKAVNVGLSIILLVGNENNDTYVQESAMHAC